MECGAYQQGSQFDTYLAVVLAVGIVLSYAPQQLTILRRRTIEGISPWFLFLMNAGSSLILGNMLLESTPILRCCPSIRPWQCLNSLLGLVQVAAAFSGPTLILLLSVRYTGFDYTEYHQMRRVFKAVMVFDAVVAVIVAAVWGGNNSRFTANLLGLVGAVLGVIQYLPQLITTHRLKHTGSLSKMTLLIQIPGGFLWCFSLYIREGSVWSTWITIFVSACLQLTLLSMAVYYSFVNTQYVIAVISKPSRSASRSASRSGSPGRPSYGTTS